MSLTAVVILNYNGEKLLKQFLPSVIEFSKEAKIIVADNGSTDQSIQILEADFPTVSIIKLDNNYGFCGGYNRALKQVDAKYYVLLNSDIEVTSGWLAPLEYLLNTDSTISAVQPKILAYNQKDHFEYAGAGGGFIDTLGYPFCRGRLFDYTEVDTGQYNDTREVFWATGACLMIRSEVYHSLGGLDEDFFAHMEEIDLCWRIQRAGGKVFYCGASHIYHVGAGTLARSNPRKTYYNFRNGLSLLFKNLSSTSLVIKMPIRIMLDWVAVIKFLVEGKRGDATAIIQAHWDFIKSLGNQLKKREELKKRYSFISHNILKGLILWSHFIMGKKKIEV